MQVREPPHQTIKTKKQDTIPAISRNRTHRSPLQRMKIRVAFPLLSAVAASVLSPSSAFTFQPTASRFMLPKTEIRMAEDAAEEDDGKVCLITGSSRGIGKCIALELIKSKPNSKIVINHIAPEKDNADAVVAEIKALGGQAIALEADCSQPDQIKAMFKVIKEKWGRCDILVNNAGIARDSLMLRMKPEQWQQVIDINLTGVYYVSQEFFKQAVRKHCGRVVNIASVVGQIGNPGQCNYAAAKAGVIGLTRSNAKEFGRRNIKVNAVCPGYIETPMTANLEPQFLEEMKELIPLNRLGKPEEVAGLVRFLALDPAADYMTGHCFDVDGGIGIGAS